MTAALDFAAGLASGVLSGFGIGGGTVLMVYMTALAGLPQLTAQTINLVYFIPCSLSSLISHVKNGYIKLRFVLPAALAGAAVTAAAAMLATWVDAGLLRKIFGGFLIIVGISELFAKKDETQED